MKVNLIAAADMNRGIGRNGKLPWKFSTDLQHFQNLTKGKVVVMGRTTFEKDLKEQALKDRFNVVLTTKSPNWDVVDTTPNMFYHNVVQDVPLTVESVRWTIASQNAWCDEEWDSEDIWIIGGGRVYQYFLPFATDLYITRIVEDYQCDTFFPLVEMDEWVLEGKLQNHWEQDKLNPGNDVQLYFAHYTRV